MKYDIEKLHTEKEGRRAGHTTDAVFNAIGCIMVSENETFLFVVPNFDWSHHVFAAFRDACIHHFNVKPTGLRLGFWGIEGYTSRVKLTTFDLYEQHSKGIHTEPIIDHSPHRNII